MTCNHWSIDSYLKAMFLNLYTQTMIIQMVRIQMETVSTQLHRPQFEYLPLWTVM